MADDSYELEPSAARPADDRRAAEAAAHPEAIYKPPRPDYSDTHFSLKHLLIYVLVLGVLSGLLRKLPVDIAAGVLGLLTLVSLIALSLLNDVPALVRLNWWLLFLLYLSFSLVAAINF